MTYVCNIVTLTTLLLYFFYFLLSVWFFSIFTFPPLLLPVPVCCFVHFIGFLSSSSISFISSFASHFSAFSFHYATFIMHFHRPILHSPSTVSSCVLSPCPQFCPIRHKSNIAACIPCKYFFLLFVSSALLRKSVFVTVGGFVKKKVYEQGCSLGAKGKLEAHILSANYPSTVPAHFQDLMHMMSLNIQQHEAK